MNSPVLSQEVLDTIRQSFYQAQPHSKKIRIDDRVIWAALDEVPAVKIYLDLELPVTFNGEEILSVTPTGLTTNADSYTWYEFAMSYVPDFSIKFLG